MTDRWTFAAGYVPSEAALLLLALCVGLAVAEAIHALRHPASPMSRALRGALFGLRLLGIGALLAMAFELTLRVEEVTPLGRRVAVLVDRSASVAIPDGETPTARQRRLEALWERSAAARAAWAEEGLLLDVRGFDDDVTPLAGELAETLRHEPDGHASDLARALVGLEETRDQSEAALVGVVVLSDGLVDGGSGNASLLESAAEALGVPITTVSLGDPVLHDVSVADVHAGEFAFVENVTEIEASIVAHGYLGRSAEVVLRRNGEVVEETPIVLGRDGASTRVRFEVAPDRVGQFVYEVAVVPQPGEATLENNARAFVVKVLRDKVRVLHVAGRPDWDVRALRTLLRRDPNVELLSYYILRDFGDIEREDTSAPLSLIPFPTDELFKEELGSFDLVILHNFDAIQHQVGQYVGNMAEYLVEGGALVLIGGDLSFSDEGYAAANMASLLPIDPRGAEGLVGDRFRPALTDAGRRHPITAWLQIGGKGWSTLPELDTFNPLRMNPREDAISASALLVHPELTDARGRPRPLLAVSEPGRGRAMVLATGSTWRMGFAPDLTLIDGARPYDLLWLGAVRWLLRDDSSGRLQLETDRPRYHAGEPVELQATALSPSYAPEPEVEILWEVLPLAGAAEAEPVARGRWTTDAMGRAESRLAELPTGAYLAVARRELEGGDASTQEDALGQHEVRRVFIVETPGQELARIDADPGIERLRRLAEGTGGLALSAVGGDALPLSLPLGSPEALPRERVEAREDHPLWNGWWALAVLLVSFGGEWVLRRRYAAP